VLRLPLAVQHHWYGLEPAIGIAAAD